MMRVGFLGVGHLAEAMIEGLTRAPGPAPDLVLSPRGRAARLAERLGLRLASDNAALVAEADMVILATRPADAVAAVASLPWRAGHILVSACAGVTIASLEREAGPAAVMRIMPLTAAALGASPTAAFPLLPAVAPLLGRLGPVIPLESEAQFDVATVSAAVYGWVQDLIRTSESWSTRRGMAPETARRLAAATFVAAGRMVGEQPDPTEVLMARLVTPGGITERGLEVLAENGVNEAWEEACDAVLAKLNGVSRASSPGGRQP